MVVNEPIIICESLVKIYSIGDRELQALQGLDLVVARGELMGIVGVSGSGKSTLMNILGGLDRPTAGRVWVNGFDLLKLSEPARNRYRRSQVGFVWQQSARNLIPYLNALENIELPMNLAGIGGRQARGRAEELLSAVGLGARREHLLQEMSGGEQQRVAIAVALANRPQILLADEPTGELDSSTAATIYQTVRDLNHAFGLTVLIVSHDPNIARQVNRVVSIRDGKTSSETIAQPATGSVYEQEPVYEELTVLDSAGRLQVPKPYLEQFDIKGRARLEVTGEGILIRPAPHVTHHTTLEQMAAETLAAPKPNRWQRLVKRVFGQGADTFKHD